MSPISRFDFFPLDSHICPLKLSTSYSHEHVFFGETIVNDAYLGRNVVLEYSVRINKIPDGERTLSQSVIGNFSITGADLHLQR